VLLVSGIGLLLIKANGGNCDTNTSIKPEEETESNVTPKTSGNKTNHNTPYHTTLQQNEDDGAGRKSII
jgi:hypothetical protein